MSRWLASLALLAGTFAAPSAAAADGGLRVFGPMVGEEADDLRILFDAYEAETGTQVTYIGSRDYHVDIGEMADRGELPDVLLLPQVGLAHLLTDLGVLHEFPPGLRAALVDRGYERLNAAASHGDPPRQYAAWIKLDTKSLVWYSPRRFSELGYEVPRSWAQMQALTETMVADGHQPWCLGLSDYAASGWPATDWIEDILIRQYPPEVYQAWMDGDIPFSDASIAGAFDLLEALLLQPGHLYGGADGALRMRFDQSLEPLVGDGPGCLMNRQANFMGAFLPDGARMAPDGDLWVYLLPPIHPERGVPMLVGGLIATLASEDPAAVALIDFLTREDTAQRWALLGDYFSAVAGSAMADIHAPLESWILRELEGDPGGFFIDASDRMPYSVGQGTFWAGMLMWFQGEDRDDVLRFIDCGWETAQAHIALETILTRCRTETIAHRDETH